MVSGPSSTAVAALSRQTLSPERVIVEAATPPDGLPEEVVVVPPGRGLAACTSDVVCFLDGRDAPVATWLAQVSDALEDGAEVARWGEIRLRADGIVRSIHLPPPVGRLGERGLLGLGLRRSVLRDDRRPPRRTRVRAIPRVLVTRRDGTTSGSGVASAGPQDDSVAARPAEPCVSVILPVHRADEWLTEQLAALAAQDYRGDWEVVVVDNSPGGVFEPIMGERVPRLRTVRATAARSAGYARNAGCRVARGDLLLFCDSDDVATPTWVSAMVAAAHDADLVGGALDSALLSPEFVEEQPAPMPDQPEFLPFARSANCGAWRDVLSAVGGWSEQFTGGGGEDVDLSWRAQLLGYRLAYAPHALVHYRLRPTVRGLAAQKWRYGLTGAPLYRMYRHAGYRRRPARQVVRSWYWLVRHAPDLAREGPNRRRWVRYAARLAGFTVGSVRHRIAFL
ncbi:glycosyltransferase [Micromonospora ureilytica]|uniref:glycosyltransferase family 2 protein n=1 Tax=Micromonospora ureilytica TaxID=709868 RepID=UPI0033E48C52